MAENGFESDVGSLENLDAEAISLDIEELDDAEYAIPAVDELPTLESILTEQDTNELTGIDLDIGTASAAEIEGSETTSVGSLLSLNSLTRPSTRNPDIPLSGVILKHAIMRGLTSQIKSASEKVNAGLASALAAGGDMLVIGTSHGLLLAFDSKQTLRWCNQESRNQGSLSALGFNHDGSRLLAGFARGHILMIDSSNGKILRTLTDVHPPGTAVLHVKFTDSPKLALCSDSGGSVFELSFTRVMGVRGCESKCLFSGSRGEVCTMEPLLLNNLPRHPLKNYTLVALATLSKVIVVCIRPRMRIVLTHPLIGPSISPPQVAWQLVVIQAPDASRVIDPVLALARDTTIHFYQVCSEAGSRVRLSPLRRMTLSFSICNLKWLNTRSLAILDNQEHLHLIDVRTQEDLEIIDLNLVGISYASSHFKGLSTGGNVSKAMALAGERACYNSIITYGGQLLLLGTRRLHVVFMRSWLERLRYLTLQKRYPDALALGLSFYRDNGKGVVGLSGMKKVRKRMTFIKTSEILIQYIHEFIRSPNEYNNETDIISTCIDYAVQLENTHLLFGPLWDIVSETPGFKANYLRALEGPLLDGSLPPRLPPIIAQELVALYDNEEKFESLQSIAVLLDFDCLDIHQITTVCRNRCLWEALIHLQISAQGDFTAPIHQLMPILQKSMKNTNETLSRDCIKLGNALLVYTSCCLAGRGFPRGELPKGQPQKAKAEVLRALLSQHTSLAEDSERQYPYLRTLLRFDARGFLDVIAMAFQEPEFKTEMGFRQRQRLVHILLSIVMPTTPLSPDNPDFLGNHQKGTVLVFAANEMAEGNISLEPQILNRLVEFLCTVNNNNDEIIITRDQKVERENAILALVNSKKLNSMTDNTLLNLSQKANFLKVAEVIFTARDDWISVGKCIVSDPYRQHEVWSWLERLPIIPFQSVLLEHTSILINIDPDRIASMISSRVPNKISNVLSKLNEHPKSEFSLLSSLYHLSQLKEDDDVKLELTTQQLERYLILMCQEDSKNVVSHINGAHGCRLDEALRIVQEAGHKEAIPVMLEKMGNYQEAYDILMKDLQDLLKIYHSDKIYDDNAEQLTIQISGLCRRSAGNLDWMPLVETVLQPCLDNNYQGMEKLRGKLLKVVLEALSGTNALSTVLERILKHPMATSGTIGDIRQLLTGVLTHSRYEQVLVETTVRLVSLELHQSLKKKLRDAGRACASSSMICSVCRQVLTQSTDYSVFFGCGHGFHLPCLGEKKFCYKCLNEKGWAPSATNYIIPHPKPPERREILPPAFMRRRDLTLKLAAPTVIHDLEDIS